MRDESLLIDIEIGTAKLPVISVVSVRKPSAAAGADPEMLDQLAEGADCVISAMAD